MPDYNTDVTAPRLVAATEIEIAGNILNGTEFAALDGITAGTAAASKALILDASEELDWAVSSASTGNVEPLNFDVTLTGAGATGGRAKFTLTADVALGAWSNALKGQVTYGSSGRTAGLGSAVVAEMTLSAGTSSGTYAPFEIELNMGASGSTGTATSLIYASVNDAASTTFDTNGYLFNIAGIAEGDSKFFNAHTLGAASEVTHGLKVRVDGSDYYLLMATAANFVD